LPDRLWNEIYAIKGRKGSRKNNSPFSHLIFRPSLSDLHSLNPQCNLGCACGSVRSDSPNLSATNWEVIFSQTQMMD